MLAVHKNVSVAREEWMRKKVVKEDKFRVGARGQILQAIYKDMDLY